MLWTKNNPAFYLQVLPQFGLLGDWLSLDVLCPGGSDGCLRDPGWISGNPTTAFQYVLNLQGMVGIAEQLGLAADAAQFKAEHAAAVASYHAVFFNASASDYGHQQTANAMPLYIGAPPASEAAAVADALVNGIKMFPTAADGGHISTGGVGARWILQALTAANRTKDALALASKTTNPSWGHMARSVPGTFWENWENCTGGSCNHIMLGGGIDPWIYHQVAGIRPPTARTVLPHGIGAAAIPAYHLHFGVDAAVVEQVGACSGSIAVPGGRASVAWSWSSANALRYTITVPWGYTANATAPTVVAGLVLQSSLANGAVGPVDPATAGGAAVTFELGAGTHSIVSTYGVPVASSM